MSAKLTFVKKIVNEGFVNKINLIINTLFGGKIPSYFNENKVYSKGDVIIRYEDGDYKIYISNKNNNVGEFNEENFTELSFTTIFKDSSILTQNTTEILIRHEAVAEDISLLVRELAGILDNRLVMNTLYRENFKSSDNVLIHKGLFLPGSINSITNQGIDFQLAAPITLQTNPTKFKLSHFISITGLPTLGCKITFNALDESPYWFDANDALLNSGFFNIPLDDFEKDGNKPYALNIQVYGECDSISSVKITDLMVVFI